MYSNRLLGSLAAGARSQDRSFDHHARYKPEPDLPPTSTAPPLQRPSKTAAVRFRSGNRYNCLLSQHLTITLFLYL